MINIWELSSSKKEVTSVNLKKWKIGRTLSWVDCYKPTEKELTGISARTSIPLSDFKESMSLNIRPHVMPYEKYSMIVFRGLYEHQKKWDTAPVVIFMFKNDIITIHDKPIEGLEAFRKMPKKSLLEIFRRGSAYFLYVFMSSVIDQFFSLMERVEEDVSRLEDEVIYDPSKVWTKAIFIEKRKLIYMNKALVADREVFSALEKQYLKEFKKEDLRLLRGLYNDTAQLIDFVGTYRDMLTSILDMYLSSISNNLNHVMKFLTIVATVVAVPTLIAGIYGMNFQRVSGWSMPELYWQFGYPFAIGIMLVSMVITYIFFKRRGWIS